MDLVFLVINGAEMILDLLIILLDVNFFLVSTLVSTLMWLIAFVYNLPGALVACVIHCGNGILLSLLCIVEALYYLTLGSVHTIIHLLRGFCSSMESLKVVGHLFTHLTLRSKEMMHRGLWNLVGSGQSLLRQVCEVCAIIMSLIAYFVNSIINICLIGTQNFFSLGLALWETIVGPFLRVTDIFAAFLARLSSSAIAMVILLWSPCQLAFELLVSMSKLLINIFFLNLYGLVLLSVIVATTILILHPQLTWTLANQVSGYLNTMPSYHCLRRDMHRAYQAVLLSLEMVLSSQAWRRLADWSLQIASWNRGGGEANHHGAREQQLAAEANQERPAVAAVIHRPVPGAPHPRRHGPLVANQVAARTRGSRDQHGMDVDLGSATQRSTSSGQLLQPSGEGPSTSHTKPATKEQLNALEEDNDPWLLLKEQEERKKCVICQDQTKTVLLLPCRHLCLCQECTEILLQQAIYQRNCPLCRQMILQTLNVYL
ncbi:E3 ubiquitin-protein ligase RNF26 [Hemicordylus capensis]|uniref:E3 ubiquitin-protein ligase RNF26 n=1 Tax=Hemicordylus capensis TaxID=884348 RepID=UPI0023032C63|nr:E3 ubiquitin-protein ligase RNF26 [Hemicordylus capensis]XP_053126119.1 E3 ubiquitin-protein ligase RNF26 [Hemicordylus capensis]